MKYEIFTPTKNYQNRKTRLKDLIGEQFGDLTVTTRLQNERGGKSTWLCMCVCGKECRMSSDHLTRKANPVKSCGCKRSKKGKDHKQWDGVGELSGNFWHNHVVRSANGDKGRRVPLEFTITKEYLWELFLEQSRKCALTGIELTLPEKSGDKTYNASVDRIDSSKGYIKGNVQWVHKDVNMMKRTYDQDYFISICKKIAENCEL